jgi:hypothetical protein
VPAKWIYDDDPICDAHRVQEGIGIDECEPIETQAAEVAKATVAEKRQPKQDPETEPRCAIAGCFTLLKPNNKSGRCTRHWYVKKGVSGGVVGKKKRTEDKDKPIPRTKAEASLRNVVHVHGDGVAKLIKRVIQETPSADSATLTLSRSQLVTIFTNWPIERQIAAVQAVFNEELGGL